MPSQNLPILADGHLPARLGRQLGKNLDRMEAQAIAVRRVARRNRIAPRQLGTLMAHGGRLVGGDA